MKPLLVTAAIAMSSIPAVADVSVVDNHVKRTIDCGKDPVIALAGNHLDITTRGTCTAITITGNHATVTSASVDALSVLGNDNRVVVGAVQKISVDGNANTVSYKAAKPPEVHNTGNANKIAQAN